MNPEIIIIIALLCINLALNILGTRVLSRNLHVLIANLDQNLAEAIKVTIENLPDTLRAQFVDGIEPPNPFQALIAKFIEDKMNAPSQEIIEPKVIQGKDGKFV